jgi:hypothetical protein
MTQVQQRGEDLPQSGGLPCILPGPENDPQHWGLAPRCVNTHFRLAPHQGCLRIKAASAELLKKEFVEVGSSACPVLTDLRIWETGEQPHIARPSMIQTTRLEYRDVIAIK